MAKSNSVRPSALLDVDDSYVAYCLDEAIWLFGNYVTDQLDKVEKGENETDESVNKRRMKRLREILEPDQHPDPDFGKFADPAFLFQ